MSADQPLPGIEEQFTLAAAAAALGVAPITVARTAKKHRIGVNWRGQAGWRFTKAEIERLRQVRRPEPSTAAADPRGRGKKAGATA